MRKPAPRFSPAAGASHGYKGSNSRPFRNGRPGVKSSGSTSVLGARAPRPSFGGGRPASGGFKGGGRSSGGRSSGGGGRGGNRGSRFATHIDVSKFINKAVIIEKTDHFVPDHAFADFQVDARLKTNIIAKNYVTPTPIQDKIIPHILRGSDVVGIANTGTGKTAAFLVPLIHKVLLNPKEKILIIVPTRELAQQIEQEFMGFAKNMALWSVCCVGGASIVPQIKALGRANNFVIGTPGRLRDLIDRRSIRLAEFATVVLDEADRMLDMGFINDIKFVVAGMPKVRHTLFFSATMSREIEGLIKTFLTNPVHISVKTSDTSQSVEQDIVRVPVGKNKIDILHDLLNQPGMTKVIIFGQTKHGVQRLAEELTRRGMVSEAIHGNKNQSQRMRALKSFKSHTVRILVATDVAARGLDISDITHVINYDIPATYDDYVHRIGRTGRAGKQGKALTFV